jgi:hypothetical protein
MVEVCVYSFLLAFAYQGQNNIVFIEYSSRSLRDFYRLGQGIDRVHYVSGSH